MKKKSKIAYKTIAEAAFEIGLINKKNNTPNKDMHILKLIYNLLKIQGMTINGAKKALNSGSIKLDQNIFSDVKGENLKQEIKNKVSKIKIILEKLKKIR